MSNKQSTYSFLPWVREGIANEIRGNEVAAGNNVISDKLRATLGISFDIAGSRLNDPVSGTISKTIALYGPGDIIGIDSRAIIKTDPRDRITNFESNYLASIDFYDEYLPWRYSPDIPDENGRLRPWLALVVLEEGKFDDGKDMTNRPLPYFILNSVSAGDVFQRSDQLWAWAHVHVNRDLISNDQNTDVETVTSEGLDIRPIIDEFKNILKENPDLAYSRILCPIRLKENTAYHAFLIPAFESGRLAGLGLDVEGIFKNSTFTPTTASWALPNEVETRMESDKFPIYHRWYFRTGAVGDFEYLVRLLEPKPMDGRVGRRDIDVTRPGSNIEGIGCENEAYSEIHRLDGVLRLGGALRIPFETMREEDKDEYLKYEEWDKPYPHKFQKQLAAFINMAADYSDKGNVKTVHGNKDLPDGIRKTATSDDPDPLITAPLYGRWHALMKRLLDENDNIPDDNWVHKLNLDPRHRVTAGFGTKVVQTNQENYMESAWQQLGKVIEANRRIRQAQFAQAAAKRWFIKYLEPLKAKNEGAFLWLTQPVQARILSKGLVINGKDNIEGPYKEETLTIQHQVKISKVPSVVFSHSIRKFARPGSRLVKSLGFDSRKNPVNLLMDRINKDEIKPAPPKTTPSGIQTLEDIVNATGPKKVPRFLLRWIERYPWIKYIVLGAAIIILILLAILVTPDLHSIKPGTGSLSGLGMLTAIFLILLFRRLTGWSRQIIIANTIKEENQTPETVDKLPKKTDFKLTIAGEDGTFSTGTSDSDEAKRFKQALKDVGILMQANQKAVLKTKPPELYFDRIVKSTIDKLDPAKSIPDYIFKTQVSIPGRIKAEMAGETFKEVMAYPEIDAPMYKPLIDISADLFLPNINLVSQNSISLLETNQPFIEAYMVGLNHEFARELLWREYLTDQRGSYFRRFWDVKDFMYETKDIDKLEAIAKSKLPETATEKEISQKLQDEIRESLMDIPKIHLWSKSSKLGDHDHRENYKKEKLDESSSHEKTSEEEDQKEAVLVIRGELLKKYPTAVIYAHKAAWQETDGKIDNKQERVLVKLDGAEENDPPRTIVKTPLYEARVDPDIYFFGFDLTVKDAKGGTGENGDIEPGWFFVIKERPGEPRFGLDIGTTVKGEIEVWNDLSWGNLIPQVQQGGFIQIPSENENIDLKDNTTEPDDVEKLAQREDDIEIEWKNKMNSSEIAYILYQAPVMVAVHAAELLPKT
jgi:hypothetical protein